MAPQTVLRSLPLDIPVLVPSSYASASTASPTSPTAEDTEKSNGPLDEDALATRTIVLIVLGIACSVHCAVPRRPFSGVALRGSFIYHRMLRAERRVRLLHLPCGWPADTTTAMRAQAQPQSARAEASRRTGLPFLGSLFISLERMRSPPAYSPAAMSGFAVPAHVCAVPAALQGWGTQLLNDAQED
ncbi:hypothetical protein EW145_g1740 [Phellinidium pouzarii]|uniref:Uncharacterized protein n=1 Tax=Phellinidium pouzarii TaxID=167371 RepID=A0A4S4LIY1_9AGAM|nr:hypothetical protein EW145_g1740 [Phellinidium pouzarii]